MPQDLEITEQTTTRRHARESFYQTVSIVEEPVILLKNLHAVCNDGADELQDAFAQLNVALNLVASLLELAMDERIATTHSVLGHLSKFFDILLSLPLLTGGLGIFARRSIILFRTRFLNEIRQIHKLIQLDLVLQKHRIDLTWWRSR
jgi:hypothetical protein